MAEPAQAVSAEDEAVRFTSGIASWPPDKAGRQHEVTLRDFRL